MAHDNDNIDNVDDNDNNDDDDNTRDVQRYILQILFSSQCLFLILCPTMFLNDIFRGYLK